jgi:hypothetical protein
VVDEQDDDEDDSKETCGFCKFMKGGDCRQQFIVRGHHEGSEALSPSLLDGVGCACHRRVGTQVIIATVYKAHGWVEGGVSSAAGQQEGERPRPTGSRATRKGALRYKLANVGSLQSLQAWSKCVDTEREAGGEFTSKCHEQVLSRAAPQDLPPQCLPPCTSFCITAEDIEIAAAAAHCARQCPHRFCFSDSSSCLMWQVGPTHALRQALCLQTMLLRECMLVHKEYYAPLLEEEEAMLREQEEAEQAMQAQQAEEQQQPATPSEQPAAQEKS